MRKIIDAILLKINSIVVINNEMKLFKMNNLADGYTYQDVIETRFYDKNITSYEDAFSHLEKITPTKKTLFLFNKRLKGIKK